jgi:hypothetical protein
MNDAIRPSWDELAQREIEATRLKEAKGLAAMHLAHGRVDDKHCGDCAHLYAKRYADVYFKCEKYGDTNGPGTDWRKKWTACGLFVERVSA